MSTKPDPIQESFLLCFHREFTGVYRNGLPLGIIKNGHFEIHHNVMPNGDRVPVDIESELFDRVSDAIYDMTKITVATTGKVR